MGKLQNFGIQLGYAEDAVLGTLAFSHVDGFDEVEEAMEHLRLAAVAYLRKKASAKSCCRDHVHVDGYVFCPKCGRKLEGARDPGPADVQEFFYDLLSTTNDALASKGIDDSFAAYGWRLDGFDGGPAECSVQAVGRWMGREDEEDRPFMEWSFPDGTSSSTYRHR